MNATKNLIKELIESLEAMADNASMDLLGGDQTEDLKDDHNKAKQVLLKAKNVIKEDKVTKLQGEASTNLLSVSKEALDAFQNIYSHCANPSRSVPERFEVIEAISTDMEQKLFKATNQMHESLKQEV